MQAIEDFDLYKVAKKLVKDIYKTIKKFPSQEEFGITSQMRRSSVSIRTNISEGFYKKSSNAEFNRYLNMASGSAGELNCLLDISLDLGFIDKSEFIYLTTLTKRIFQMINKLRKKLTENNK